MKRAGATRGQLIAAAAAFIIVVVASSYLLFPGQSQTTGTSAGSTTSPETTQTAQASSISSSRSGSGSSSSSAHSSISTSSSSTATSTSSSSLSSTSSTLPRLRISHVVIVMMENEEYGSVIGNASAPYQNSLAVMYATAADYFAVAHPSLPNYLALVSGNTFGVSDDCLPSACGLPAGATAVTSLLDSHNLPWREYAESMPSDCSQVNSADGLYFPKHNPFVYFTSITGNNGSGIPSSYCQSHVVSLSKFYLDLQGGNLPNYSFVTPNICHDAHSCPLSEGDTWLSTFVPTLVDSSAFASTALFIVYDEGSSSDLAGGGGHVACILVSPFARPGYVSNVAYGHYSLLVTVETIFSLGDLGRNDTSASPMNDMFVGGVP